MAHSNIKNETQTSETPTSGKFVIKASPEEAKSYDFVSERRNKKQTTVLESIGHLVKGCLGGGIVAIHESYKTCGLFTALVLTFVLGVLLSYCIYILVRSAQKMYGRFQIPVMSYPDVAEAACAMSPWVPLRKYQKFGRYCVDVTIGLDLFGSCVVYMVVIARTIKQLILHTNESNDDGIRYYLLALLIPCILITWILELKYLAPFSIVADFFIGSSGMRIITRNDLFNIMERFNVPTFKGKLELLELELLKQYSAHDSNLVVVKQKLAKIRHEFKQKWSAARSTKARFLVNNSKWLMGTVSLPKAVAVVIATVVYGSRSATYSPIDTEQFPVFNDIGGVFVFMGAVIFSMEGVGVSMAIENHMAEPKKFPLVLIGAMSIVISMVAAVGFFGFWGFGYQAKSPVTLNFPWSWISIILKLFMALMIYVTFALNFWVPFDLLWHYLKRRHEVSKHWFWARLYRSVVVMGIMMIALIFPNVSSFIGLIGAFCLSNMGFMYPAVIELIVNWETYGAGKMGWRVLKCILIVLFGLALCFIGTYTSVKALIKDVYG